MNAMASDVDSQAAFAQSAEETVDPSSSIIEAPISSDVRVPDGNSGSQQPVTALTEEALEDGENLFGGRNHGSGRPSIDNADRGDDRETDAISVRDFSTEEDSLSTISDMEQRNREARRGITRDLPPLKQRLRKANKRVLQHQSYTRLVEDRLASLETAMAKLKGQQENQRGDEKEVVDEEEWSRPVTPIIRRRYVSSSEVTVEDPYTLVPAIARMPLATFRPPQPKAVDDRASSVSSKHPVADAPLTPLHAIEVCTSVPTGPSNTRRARSRHPSVTSAEPPDDQGSSVIEPDLLARIPDRVRIRSGPLLKTLEKISDGKFTTHKPERENRRRRRVQSAHPPIRSSEGAETTPPVVFLRPFKLFVEFEDKIRTYTKELEVKWKLNNASPEATPVIHIEGDETDPIAVEDVTMSKEALTHLQLLIEFLDFDLKGLFELRRQVKEGTLKTIAFVDLWLLFSHGDEVCTNQFAAQVYRILHFSGGRRYLNSGLDDEIVVRRRERTRDRDRYGAPPRARDTYYDDDEIQYLTPTKKGSDFVIQCFSFDYDGFDYGPSQQIFSILWYEGEVPITSLTVFPHRFRDVNGRIPSIAGKPIPTKQELIQRGKRFVKLSKVMHMQYKGRCIGTGDEVDSQVIIDFNLGLQQNRELWTITLGVKEPIGADGRETREESAWIDPQYPRQYPRRNPCQLPGCCDNDFIHLDNELDSGHAKDLIAEQEEILVRFTNADDLTDEDFMLFPVRVIGFVLRDRNWALLDIDKVVEVQPLDSGAGLDALCLPKGHKDTLLAMVRNHSRGTASNEKEPEDQTQFDLIPGKGKGLIVLLHGAPGVGKTSTAESIAAHTNRPLFPITCGDIGETADDVDTKLRSTFQLAHKWGCVLLLDEADVFLQRRNKTDLQRNSIVSVFLRVLEYYSGILFLTTNRIGTIDPAFKSRIHMSLYYPSLDRDATREIWTWHIKNVVKNKKDITVDKKEIFKFALAHFAELEEEKVVWNGRQIRNAFQTAVALAEYDAFKINEKYKAEEKPHLKAAHFEQVAKASKDFDKYLQVVWGGLNENDLSRRAQERAGNPRDHPSKGDTIQRGGRDGGLRIPRSPATRSARDDEFPDDDDDWDESTDKTEEPADEDEDFDNERPAARGKSGETLRPESSTKRASWNERK
ncbi:hypothetical protein MMC27_008241 [Xylographa pallens]|nr:hypothetical protein [Xylographa pallens]